MLELGCFSLGSVIDFSNIVRECVANAHTDLGCVP